MGINRETIVHFQSSVLILGAFALLLMFASLVVMPWLPAEKRARRAKFAARRVRCKEACRIDLTAAQLVAGSLFSKPEDVYRAYRMTRAVYRRLLSIGLFPRALSLSHVEFITLLAGLRERSITAGLLDAEGRPVKIVDEVKTEPYEPNPYLNRPSRLTLPIAPYVREKILDQTRPTVFVEENIFSRVTIAEDPLASPEGRDFLGLFEEDGSHPADGDPA